MKTTRKMVRLSIKKVTAMIGYVSLSTFFLCSTAMAQNVSLKEEQEVAELNRTFTTEEIYKELKTRAMKENKNADNKENSKLSVISSAVLYKAMISQEKAIYGPDDRAEAIYSIYDQDDRIDTPLYTNSKSVVAFIKRGHVKDNGDGTITLVNFQSFENQFKLCQGERFAAQPSIAYCTGFAVSGNVIVSAGHCINYSGEFLAADQLKDMVLLFGYTASDKGATLRYDKKDVYYPIRGFRKLEHNEQSRKDYLLLEVDRKIPEERIVKLSKTPVRPGQKVYVIGHPCGLPMKSAGGAYVRDNGHPDFFVSNLDTYGGNSGSPVFNADNNEVEGILVRGETDFVNEADCRKSRICPDNGCRGEDVTRTNCFMEALNTFVQ